jgi:hypothetical protein
VARSATDVISYSYPGREVSQRCSRSVKLPEQP